MIIPSKVRPPTGRIFLKFIFLVRAGLVFGGLTTKPSESGAEFWSGGLGFSGGLSDGGGEVKGGSEEG